MKSFNEGLHLQHYEKLYNEFYWHVPNSFNLAKVCCTRWAREKSRPAIFYEDDVGHSLTLTYAEIQLQANQLSNVLHGLGIKRGDRVAVLLPQIPETAIAHIACFQSGAISVPMSVLFGPDAVEYRLQNSAAAVLITDQSGYQNCEGITTSCSSLRHLLTLDCDSTDGIDWHTALANESPHFDAAETLATDPALIIYTSGTTGAPKGALIPHCAVIGNLPGFVASQNWFPKENDVFWSPADWAWTGGLMDALLPTLYFGKPIVGYRGRFSAEKAFYLMEKYGVTNTFLFPTALKMMMKAHPAPREKYTLQLRAIMSAGEAVGDAVFHWCEKALGITPNEMFGQTEMNYIVGNSSHHWPAKPGSMGRPYPGHRVAVIDDNGHIVKQGEIGEVSLHRTDIHGHLDPILFSGYWQNPDATRKKFAREWCRTGDLASVDKDGYFWYQGRSDDMFKAAGYRIGPTEIENCLIKHPAVLNAAVAPKPDKERGNIVKAFIVLTPGTQRSQEADDTLIAELQSHVKGKLAPYEYPKEIEFVDELPMTPTGKIQRRILRNIEAKRANKRAIE